MDAYDDGRCAVATKDEVIRDAVEGYLADLDDPQQVPATVIGKECLEAVREAVMVLNLSEGKGSKWQVPGSLPVSVIATLLIRTRGVVRLAPAGRASDRDLDLVAMYRPAEGTYDVSPDSIKHQAQQMSMDLSEVQLQGVYQTLRRAAPRVFRCTDPNLVPVQNGVFDVSTKTLSPFSPDVVFTWKTQVPYDPQAQPVSIHNDDDGTDWDFDSWMDELSDDPEVVQLLWEMLHASVRPQGGWDKVVLLYSDRGNNGKGTLCELIRNLLGPEAYCSIQVSHFDKDFALTPLSRVSMILTDENDVGTFGERMGNWKTVTTGDVFQLSRKYLDPVSLQFVGFQIQCFNEIPRFRDKSPSLARRLLFVPMTKCFTGKERKYIKKDYLKREDVLRYVLRTLLEMDVKELSQPEASKDVLEEFKDANDPVREFWKWAEPQLVWDFQPYEWLYELYLAWSRKANPEGRVGKQKTFTSQLKTIIDDLGHDHWEPTGNTRPAARGRMDAGEPLVAVYGIGGLWSGMDMDADAKGGWGAKARAGLPGVSRGLLRVAQHPSSWVDPGNVVDFDDLLDGRGAAAHDDDHDETGAEGAGEEIR